MQFNHYSMIKLDIPFHPNAKDNIHCFQASLRMVLAYFEPDTKYSYAEIDQVTGFRRGYLTWTTLAILWLASKGYRVKDISTFDCEEFAKHGKMYLKKYWRPDVYAVQNSQSDLVKEQRSTKRALYTKGIEMIKQKPTVTMLEKHLMSGWLAIANIDISRFNNTKHYSAHSIVVTAITPSSVAFHDPGSASRKNRRIRRIKFAEVLSAGELMLIKAPK